MTLEDVVLCQIYFHKANNTQVYMYKLENVDNLGALIQFSNT